MFDGTAGAWDFRVELWPGGLISFYTYAGCTDNNTVDSKKNVIDGSWHHVVLTKHEDGPIKIYIDGALDAEGKGLNGPTHMAPQITVGGRNPFDRYFEG